VKRGLLIGASVFLLGAGERWQWRLPPGIAAPAVPADNPMRAAKVELGRRLFYYADLSRDGRSRVRPATNSVMVLPMAAPQRSTRQLRVMASRCSRDPLRGWSRFSMRSMIKRL